ncbi:hypothetical protein BASA81_012748 [Batrachochytrium salamandrivorans]|nr:hypothetical protein BASA81_012748 [Batrachochytrium salamandrivorans]
MGQVLRAVLLLVVLIIVLVVYLHQSARVILPVRDAKKAKLVEQEINRYIADLPNQGSVQVVPGVDFASLETVRQFAAKMAGEKIDILVNNAGMLDENVGKTVDGNERVYQVNHLAPFLLTKLLLPNLAPKSRVVFVGSLLHYFSAGVLGDKYSVQVRGLGKETASGMDRYFDTKLMNTMTAMSFHERFGDLGIAFHSIHPGYAISNLESGMDSNLVYPFDEMAAVVRKVVARTTQQGAVTQITVATHPTLTAGGKYFSDYCINTLCNKDCFYCDKENAPGVVPHKEALDRKARDWLWETSCKLTGV